MPNSFEELGLLIWKNIVPWKRTWWKVLLNIFALNIILVLAFLLNMNDKNNPTVKRYTFDLTKIKHNVLRFVYPRSATIEKIVKDVGNKAKSKTQFVDSIEDLEKAIKRTKSDKNSTVLGIQFNNWEETSFTTGNEVSYKILLATPDNDEFKKIYRIGVYDADKPSHTYLRQQFQYMISKGIMHEWLAKKPLFTKLYRIPEPSIKAYIGAATETRTMLKFGLYFVMMGIFLDHLKKLVQDKESKIKDTLSVMGMLPWTNFLSHFLVSLFEALLVIIIAMVLLKVNLTGTSMLKLADGFLLFLIFFYSAVYGILFGSALSTVVFSTNLKASLGGMFLAIHSLVLYYLVEKHFPPLLDFSCIFPFVSLWVICISIVNLEYVGLGLTFKTITAKIWTNEYTQTLSVFDAILWSLISVAIFLLIIVVDLCGLSNLKQKCLSLFKKNNIDFENTLPLDKEKYFEPEPKGLEAGIKVQNLVKNFSSNCVVNGVSLNIYEGQITVLLGHNGAGKSTTMSMITGLLSPTSGTAYLNGKSIITDTVQARENLGLCPQHDILFEFLTVEEHIWFSCKMKRIAPDTIQQEIDYILAAVNLTPKRNNMTNQLSGGMKRRLSLAMALAGGSKIVVLDEPSSGLDPDTRRDIWRLLQAERQHRTILMTTHFMDEADALGDRIAIMSHGVVQCCGSPFFLKSIYGAGYHLNFIKSDSQANNNSILQLIKSHLPSSFIENSSETELQILLTLSDQGSNSGSILASLFNELDTNLSSLRISNYGLSVTTMEEVFLKVGNIPHDESLKKNKNEGCTTVPLKEKDILMVGNVKFNFFKQLLALWIKRIIYSTRKPMLFLLQVVVPALLFILPSYFLIHDSAIEKDVHNHVVFSEDKFDNSILLYGGDSKNLEIQKNYLDRFTKLKTEKFSNYPTLGNDATINKYWFKLIKDKGTIEFIQKYRIGLLNANETSVYPLCTNNVYFACDISIRHLMNAFLPAEKSINVEYQSFVKSLDQVKSNEPNTSAIIAGMNLIFSLLFLSATFAYFTVDERINGSLHLQMLTGAKIGSYWISNIIWDYILFAICLIAIVISNHFLNFFPSGTTKLFLLIALSGLAFLPIVYFLSSYFDNPASALYHLILIFLMGTIPLVFILNSSLIPKKPRQKLDQLFQMFHPAYLVYQVSLKFCMSEMSIPGIEKPEVDYKFKYAAFQVVFYISILIFNEYNLQVFDFGGLISIWAASRKKYGVNEDEDVTAERSKIASTSPLKLKSDYAITLSNVSHFYGHLCMPSLCAVNHVSFAVSRGECFGLLGVNGAGKSTAFKMITGINPISVGEIYLNGRTAKIDIVSMGLQNLGYCPQFDALPWNLTAEEVLTFYARMRGVPHSIIAHHVQELVDMMGLTPYAKKVCLHYSGGNKRKLSTAVTLAGWPDVVCLDEPSTGMDPEAKRFMWNALSRYREAGKTIIITSHSLEECEALCSRLVIMVNGELKCIGSCQYLKNKFGNGFSVQIQLNRMLNLESEIEYKSHRDKVLEFLISNFQHVELKDDHHGLLFIYILKSSGFSLGQFFDKMERYKSNLQVEDYNISQCSLEQVFIDFARAQKLKHQNQGFNLCSCLPCCKKGQEITQNSRTEPAKV